MTLVKQGHESISTSHVAFLTPFLPREGCGRGWRSEEGGGADDKSRYCSHHTMPSPSPGVEFCPGCHQKLGRGKPSPRTPKLPFFLKIRGEIDFLTPASAPSGMWIGFGIKSLRPIYVCVWRGGEERETIIILIVEITDPDHYRNLISCFAGSGLISPPNFMGICSFPRHPADTQIN